ncbi:MAG: penicillin-binding protein 2 [Parcubacteria group bacterium]|nr:penicillin-binding protein 2 [Parcubacteria group bacterium]
MAPDPFIIQEHGGGIRDRSLPAFRYEVDGDIVAADSYRKPGISPRTHRYRGSAFAVFAFLIFGALVGKLYYLQVVRGEEYYGAAEGNRIRSVPLIPARGVIFDADQKRLAYNVPDFAIVVVPADLPETQEEEDAIFETIARALGVPAFDLVERFADVPRDRSEPVEIMRGLSQEQAVMLLSDAANWSGVEVVPTHSRAYAFPDELSHALGYTGSISPDEYASYVGEKGYLLLERVGKAGLEKTYQERLRGSPGRQLLEVDSRGLPSRALETDEAAVGDNLYLHLDATLQKIAWDALKESVLAHKSPGGTVVALDPRSGAVRALVSWPSFSSEEFARGISVSAYQSLLSDPGIPLLNRATSGEYPSGSTIKLVVGAAALEERLVNRYTSVLSTGGIRVGAYWYPDWRSGGHGETNIIHGLADSVNTFFYAVGGGWGAIEGLGIDRIALYGRRFGLAAATGIDVPSERAGFLPSREWKEEVKGEQWYLGDTYHAAIGQGDVLVTPLQVANFTAAIANGGTLYSPRLADRVGREYELSEIIAPVILNPEVASPENVRIIQEGLRAAVTYGTVRSLGSLPVAAAGKTGTAEWSESKLPHGWFTGYAPYEDPELVVTVLVEQGGGGDLAATPVAKKIFEWYFGRDRVTSSPR